jgi:hypothetical protein
VELTYDWSSFHGSTVYSTWTEPFESHDYACSLFVLKLLEPEGPLSGWPILIALSIEISSSRYIYDEIALKIYDFTPFIRNSATGCVG